MSGELKDMISLLYSKNNQAAYEALKELQAQSEITNGVYEYIDEFIDMLENENSYIRTRGLVLIALNSKWDINYKIDEIIIRYLEHITDKKPITARQCIKILPIMAAFKPELKEAIINALLKADTTIYADSMQPLVYKDIRDSLERIKKL